jgi:phosphoglycolate phosphatase
LFENSVYPGVHDALAGLRQAGHRLCVVTSKAAVYADRIIDHFDLRELLPHVYGAELSGERSTKAELIAHALEAERVAPSEACMVGDREHDIIGAKANGTGSIGVTWGYGSRAELEASGADRVVDTLQELITAASSLAASERSR